MEMELFFVFDLYLKCSPQKTTGCLMEMELICVYSYNKVHVVKITLPYFTVILFHLKIDSRAVYVYFQWFITEFVEKYLKY